MSWQPGAERSVLQFFRMNLVLVIPLFVLSLKLLIRYASREDVREILRTIPSLPLDLTLIAISLMLTAFARITPAYFEKFDSQQDAYSWAAFVLFGLFVSGVVLNRLICWSRTSGQKLYAASKQLREKRLQPAYDPKSPSIEIAGRMLWALVYCLVLALLVGLEMLISMGTLAYVLHLIR